MKWWRKWKDMNANGMGIRAHVGLHLSIFGAAMFIGLVLALLFTNNIIPNMRSVTTVLTRECSDAGEDLNTHLGSTAAEVVVLSKALSADIESILNDADITFEDLSANADILPELLDRETDLLQLALERANCSGVFIALDTTINPEIFGAENSRAGVYIRRVEPKRIGNPSEILYLRGNTQFAIKRGMTLQANWNLEFDISERNFWSLPRQACLASGERNLTNLYVWSFEAVIPENGETSLLCSIPLLDSKGNFLGVCGLEISPTNFRYYHPIKSEQYSGLVLVLSSEVNNMLNFSNALISGNTETSLKLTAAKTMQITKTDEGMDAYSAAKERYRVVHMGIPLYAKDAYYSDSQFALSVLMPESVYKKEVLADVLRFTAIFISMLILGCILSLVLSKRLTKPLSTTVEALKNSGSKEPGDNLLVGIKELDELLRLYANRNPGQAAQVSEMFADFIEKLKQLTPTERTVVAHYMDAKSFAEVQTEMFIATSTLKTHNIHIYKKLDIKGIDELRLYLDLILNSNYCNQLIELLNPQ